MSRYVHLFLRSNRFPPTDSWFEIHAFALIRYHEIVSIVRGAHIKLNAIEKPGIAPRFAYWIAMCAVFRGPRGRFSSPRCLRTAAYFSGIPWLLPGDSGASLFIFPDCVLAFAFRWHWGADLGSDLDGRWAGDFSLVGESACGLCGWTLPHRGAWVRAAASPETHPALAVVADRNVSGDCSQSVWSWIFQLPETRTADGAALCPRMERGLEPRKRVDDRFHGGRTTRRLLGAVDWMARHARHFNSGGDGSRSHDSSKAAAAVRRRLALLCARVLAGNGFGKGVDKIRTTQSTISFYRLGCAHLRLCGSGNTSEAMGTGRAPATLPGGAGSVLSEAEVRWQSDGAVPTRGLCFVETVSGGQGCAG